MKEGAGAGVAPNLQVFEFGPLNLTRHPSDILPCLSIFRHLFAPLPTNPAEMHLRTVKVPIMDVECVTWTLLKVSGPTWYLNIKKGNPK